MKIHLIITLKYQSVSIYTLHTDVHIIIRDNKSLKRTDNADTRRARKIIGHKGLWRIPANDSFVFIPLATGITMNSKQMQTTVT